MSQDQNLTSIEYRVRQVIADELNLPLEKVRPESTIADDLGADSLETLKLIMELEEAFGIKIPDDAKDNVVTVADVVKYVQERA